MFSQSGTECRGGEGQWGGKKGGQRRGCYSRTELLLAEVAIHILVQMKEGVAHALGVAPAEPALLGLFLVGLHPQLHELVPHGAHHYVPDTHPAQIHTCIDTLTAYMPNRPSYNPQSRPCTDTYIEVIDRRLFAR